MRFASLRYRHSLAGGEWISFVVDIKAARIEDQGPSRRYSLKFERTLVLSIHCSYRCMCEYRIGHVRGDGYIRSGVVLRTLLLERKAGLSTSSKLFLLLFSFLKFSFSVLPNNPLFLLVLPSISLGLFSHQSPNFDISCTGSSYPALATLAHVSTAF